MRCRCNKRRRYWDRYCFCCKRIQRGLLVLGLDSVHLDRAGRRGRHGNGVQTPGNIPRIGLGKKGRRHPFANDPGDLHPCIGDLPIVGRAPLQILRCSGRRTTAPLGRRHARPSRRGVCRSEDGQAPARYRPISGLCRNPARIGTERRAVAKRPVQMA